MRIKPKRNHFLPFPETTEQLRCFLTAIFFVMATVLSSCSLTDSEKGGSVIFHIDGETAQKIQQTRSARAAEDGVLGYLDISLHDKNGVLKTQEEKSITKDGVEIIFEELTVGSEIWAEAEVYDEKKQDGDSAKRTLLYKGTSEKLTIKDGTNTLTLKLTANPGTANIRVTIKTTESSGITVQSAKDGNTVTFTAETGWTSYTWKVDGTVQSATGNVLRLDTTGWSEGTYDVTLSASKTGASDLYSAQVIIK